MRKERIEVPRLKCRKKGNGKRAMKCSSCMSRTTTSCSSSSRIQIWLAALVTLIILVNPSLAQQLQQQPSRFPLEINLRAAVLHAPPFATVETQPDGSKKYGGFQTDMLKSLTQFAAADNITLNFNLTQSPEQYGSSFDLVANDCEKNMDASQPPPANLKCNDVDLIVGNFYATPDRALRADLSPAWLRSTISLVKYIDKSPGKMDYTTLSQASKANETVCLKDGTFYAGIVRAKWPELNFQMCTSLEHCLQSLKEEKCVLHADDELQLRYQMAWDTSLEVTREHFNTQYIVWPLSFRLDPMVSILFNRWILAAVTNATLDELYFKYFQKALCPVGTAGESCELPCDPDHGEANARGVCVCQSTKWTGDDCSIEVLENKNMIPSTLLALAYAMLGCNISVIVVCALWLFWQRETTQVKVSQPFFLTLVLIGCLISSSTIVALAQEHEGEGPVRACMAIPWLYSVGFSITFGTLFAKIRRIYIIFKSAMDMRRNIVTVTETLIVIGVVLLVDVVLLTVWTIVDPLVWERTVIAADQFGVPLESQGVCTSSHWMVFAGIIAVLHFTLLAVACYLCYIARGIPTKFSEGKYVSIAMISNLQIFVVAVPILIILGTDSQSSFFVRCVVIWMNDLAVVLLVFGNLIYSVHWDPEGTKNENVRTAVGNAVQEYSQTVKRQTSSGLLYRSSSMAEMSAGSFRSAGSHRIRRNVELDDEVYPLAHQRMLPRSSFRRSQSDMLQNRIPPMIIENTESGKSSAGKECSAIVDSLIGRKSSKSRVSFSESLVSGESREGSFAAVDSHDKDDIGPFGHVADVADEDAIRRSTDLIIHSLVSEDLSDSFHVSHSHVEPCAHGQKEEKQIEHYSSESSGNAKDYSTRPKASFTSPMRRLQSSKDGMDACSTNSMPSMHCGSEGETEATSKVTASSGDIDEEDQSKARIDDKQQSSQTVPTLEDYGSG